MPFLLLCPCVFLSHIPWENPGTEGKWVIPGLKRVAGCGSKMTGTGEKVTVHLMDRERMSMNVFFRKCDRIGPYPMGWIPDLPPDRSGCRKVQMTPADLETPGGSGEIYGKEIGGLATDEQ